MKFSRLSKPTDLAAVAPRQNIPAANRLWIEQLRQINSQASGDNDHGMDVIFGLSQTPKSLPPHYFYDDRGSHLFEEICDLPEYYPTRTEASILRHCAHEIAQITGDCEIVELGSGSSTKTRILLDARVAQGLPLRYLPIDVSGGMLEASAKQLLADYPTLSIYGLVGTYEQALAQLPPLQLSERMICFLGSSLGNLNPAECDIFFSEITNALHPTEYFLLGIDLHKPTEILEPAYNDAQGVTAAFNLNCLQHLNWRFNGNFDINKFAHVSFYNLEQRQIEMHLRCLESCTVTLKSLDLTVEFQAGETMMTEISRKFDLQEMRDYLWQSHGLATVRVWTDPNQWFGLMLCQLQPASF